jgi:hypothetical protein
MNPFSYLKSLFGTITVGVPSPNQVPPPAPPNNLPPISSETERERLRISAEPPKPEPSCLIKGIAQTWITAKGWKVTRKREKISAWKDYFRWTVNLRHQKLGILIKCYEMSPLDSVGYPCVHDLSIVIEGDGIGISSEDEAHLKQAIESHPYSALKSRQMVKAKQDATRADKTKVIEELGCPPIDPNAEDDRFNAV